MNTADYIILGIIGVSVFLGVRRGFVTEAFSLAIWLIAFIVAKMFSTPMALLVAPYIDPPSLRVPAAFVILFVGTLMVGGLIKRLLRELINVTGLTTADRLLGMMFGAARGALIVIVSLGVLSRTTEMPKDPWWRQSQLVPQLMVFESWSTQVSKDAWKWITRVTS